ncbi:MAG TPA: transposase [Gammaproteobacteria bacterium]|nr:transposase [Gammaproteobacteria bacterium]
MRTGRQGALRTYNDTAILYMAWLSAQYGLALRATKGLLASVMKLRNAELPVPDYTILCRRRQTLDVRLPRRRPHGPLHVVVDGTTLMSQEPYPIYQKVNIVDCPI